MERWKKTLSIDGREVEAEFVRRPFREGLEVSAEIDGEIIRVAELGLGEEALIERLAAEIRRKRANNNP